MNNYCLPIGYQSRSNPAYKNMLLSKQSYQIEVYLEAFFKAKLNKYKTIVDIGCGNASKLLTFFSDDFRTIGVDVEKTVKKLKVKYPNRIWLTSDSELPEVDLVIAADVIEHVLEPTSFLQSILSMKPKMVILSTPDRESLSVNQMGPPKSLYHVREWNQTEFKTYIATYFNILTHKTYYNVDHVGQYIVCEPL